MTLMRHEMEKRLVILTADVWQLQQKPSYNSHAQLKSKILHLDGRETGDYMHTASKSSTGHHMGNALHQPN